MSCHLVLRRLHGPLSLEGTASRTRLANLSWAFWTYGRTNLAGISRFGEMAGYSGLYKIHSCALRREVSHHELFAKIPSLRLYLI